MTRTEITRQELDEKERHNREEEMIGKAGVVVNAAKMLMGKGGIKSFLPGGSDDRDSKEESDSDSKPFKKHGGKYYGKRK